MIFASEAGGQEIGETKEAIFLMHYITRLSSVDAHKWSHIFSRRLLPQQFSCEACGLICEKTLPCFLGSVENLTTFFVDLWMGALENPS